MGPRLYCIAALAALFLRRGEHDRACGVLGGLGDEDVNQVRLALHLNTFDGFSDGELIQKMGLLEVTA